MSPRPICLYCQQANPASETQCRQCGMPLPAEAALAGARRVRRFTWFCVGLAVLCVAMFFWLPRDIA
ncbi:MULTISPECIES: protein DnrP [Pseudomonas]|uniref:protein DnrP n=1 Tax=Pseudomonas TaxID=286 RepID=UPI000876CF5F|nr:MULTISPECIES: protein DnrP [Pseudomonas]MDB6446332.1 protein DnrP [Pseudomonas sp. 21TX0197]MDT8905818.1 protein DnrP [Pseudomonas prosekii]NHN67984.1 protein DnrP [Pseudomonas fluorescens]ROO34598.1 protein DnrP [Pseudomonas sp. AF76]ROO34753.1 protein DnrP [Pseudomonas sp. 7SR1]